MAPGPVMRPLRMPVAGTRKSGDPEIPPRPPGGSQGPLVGNARLAFMMFLAAEAMFFAGLLGAFLVFRLAAPAWPPPFQPRLPLLVTGLNTAVLILSGVTLRLALGAGRREDSLRTVRWLGMTLLLGASFLFIQGYEWIRLLQFGLTLQSGVYGATFYTLIGCHGAHVLGALVWLGLVSIGVVRGRRRIGKDTGMELCAMYWTFVVALWPLLYGLVYLY